jgi:uncharacterized protein
LIVDTGILYALADRSDKHHKDARRIFERRAVRVVPEAVVVEVDWLILERLGVDAEIAFLDAIATGNPVVESATFEDRARAAEIVAKYREAELGYVDAIVVAIAERLGDRIIATVDRRHFSAIRPRHTSAFQLIP